MFANSVISRSSISISSLLLSSLHSPPLPPPPPSLPLSLAFCLRSCLLVYVLPTRFFLSSRFCASSECNLQASRRYALSRHIRPLRARSLSFSPSIVRPSRLSHLCPPRLSFIYRAARVSLFLALLLIDLPGEFAFTRHRSKRLALAPSLSLSLLLFAKTGRSVGDRFVHSRSVSFLPGK